MANVQDLSQTQSIINEYVADLRDVTVQVDREGFRLNLQRIGSAMAYIISKHLAYEEISVETPLESAPAKRLERQPVIATVFRAGLPLYEGLLHMFPYAGSGFVGAYRKHDDKGGFTIASDYCACPPLEERVLILADPMLATGQSLIQSLDVLIGDGGRPSNIHIVCAIASKEGCNYVETELNKRGFTEAIIWCAAVDSELNDKKYIVPGLGDAGDLAFGDKTRS